MSSSKLFMLDKDYKVNKKIEFQNSWLYTPIIVDF